MHRVKSEGTRCNSILCISSRIRLVKREHLNEFRRLNPSLKFSLRTTGRESSREIVELAVRAERLGFDTFWHVHNLHHKYSWINLTAVAISTGRIRIGPCVVNPYTCNPCEIAMATCTLDEVSEGRSLLGLGAGAYGYLGPLGYPLEKYLPIAAARDACEVIRALVRGETVSYVGRTIHWQNIRLVFNPPRSNIQIYLGAKGAKMLELVGKIADGGLVNLFPPEYATRAFECIRTGSSLTHRKFESIDIHGLIWFSVARDESAAKDVCRVPIALIGPRLLPPMLEIAGLGEDDFTEIREVGIKKGLEQAAHLVGDDMVDRLAVCGTPEQCLERLKKIEKTGLGNVVLSPLGPDTQESMTLIAEKILPHFR